MPASPENLIKTTDLDEFSSHRVAPTRLTNMLLLLKVPLLLELVLLSWAGASPVFTTPSSTKTTSGIASVAFEVRIVNQTRQLNDDGSYAFGYESEDGSYRVENRDASGLVKGKYGYIDPTGERKEFEYAAGQPVKKVEAASVNSIVPSESDKNVEDVTTKRSIPIVPTYIPLVKSDTEEDDQDPEGNLRENREAVSKTLPSSTEATSATTNNNIKQAILNARAANADLKNRQRMFKIGQSIFRRPAPANASVTTLKETATETIRNAVVVDNVPDISAVSVSPIAARVAPAAVEIQPARQVVIEQPIVTNQAQIVQAVTEESAVLRVPTTTSATVIEQPAIISRTTEVSAIPAAVELPITQQIVVEQQQPRLVIPQPATSFFTIPTETIIQQQPVRHLVFEERVQQPPQQVFQIVSVPASTTFIQQTPIIRTTQTTGHLEQFFTEFPVNGNVANTLQFIGNAGLTSYNRNFLF